MWLTSSSIGRKLIMSITGACLVLFLTFHALMNGVAIFWPQAYNVVCEFLGANWYALVASIGLAALFIVHIIYALWLTVQNRRARGNERYAVNTLPKGVEWSSKNMLVLGFVVLAFLALHLVQFWSKMQLAEIRHSFGIVEGVAVPPAAGTAFLQYTFQNVWVVVVYAIALIALWFHLTHGFWSMMHSAGWDNDIWRGRLKCIGNWWVTIVVGLFLVEGVVFTCVAKYDKDHNYLGQKELIEQYKEFTHEFVSAYGDDAINSADGANCLLDECGIKMECPKGDGKCDKHDGKCDKHEGKCEHHHGDCPEHKGECKHDHKCPKGEGLGTVVAGEETEVTNMNND